MAPSTLYQRSFPITLSVLGLVLVLLCYWYESGAGTSASLSGRAPQDDSALSGWNPETNAVHSHTRRHHHHHHRHHATDGNPLIDLTKREPSPEDSDAFVDMHTNISLARRDDYSCGPGKPCSNGACCGASGYCGYGSTYCGDGCVSNCNAVAECGKDSSPSGKTCPLNTCCSQYGFCGTTADFCGTNCQSHCTLHPTPPGGGTGNVLSRVIGYYESWSARLSCHKMAPSDLPLDALTHLNYAFAYIDPSSFEIVTMDPQTPQQLFQEVADVKKFNSGLKVWVSVGGWTFSDNDTATQPVFGNIASTEANRQKFANNVLRFLNQYGFDGLDIDWEYPGAPDRGGKEEDTQNYVSLLKTLRSTFDGNPRGLGITFTAPSSYWYLKWFDLPGLIQYADWINLMTYDLHGVWDRQNPIGSIVQGHTNLTEIGYAVELFWRVGVPPSKISMGFGFYGRAFELADPSCTTPGCPFSGGAAPGQCSDSSGILMYYEIMNLLKQHPDLKPVHDEEAAIKYVVFDNNQWVSYDDADTFKQKVEWANKQGLSGALIWASDTDDDQYSAHSGLVGKSFGHPNLEIVDTAFASTRAAVTQNLQGELGQDCKIQSYCTDQRDSYASRCPSGQSHVGWEKGKCGRNQGNSICCPANTAPKKCIWRGSGGDCNGQCHPGEATLFGSSWGGYPTESNQNKCSRGYKVFCCEATDWSQITQGCSWTDCGGGCDDSQDEVSYRVHDSCTVFHPTQKYCCPKPAQLYDCTWRGTWPDCADAKCQSDEVTLDTSTGGGSAVLCSWGRKRTDCCKVSAPAPAAPLMCKQSLCDFDPDLCDESTYEMRKRDLHDDSPLLDDDDLVWAADNTTVDTGLDLVEDEDLVSLEKRGGARRIRFELEDLGLVLTMLARAYPSRGTLFGSQARLQEVLREYFNMAYARCDDTTINGDPITDVTDLPKDGQAEHPLDLVVLGRFVEHANRGELPTGGSTRTPAIAGPFFQNAWRQDNQLPAGLPPVTPRSKDLRNPSQRVYEAFGSNQNASPFVLTAAAINGVKGKLMNREVAITDSKFKKLVETSLAGNEQAVERFIQEIRHVIGVFRYMRDPEVLQRFNDVRDDVRRQLVIVEANTQGSTGLAAHWDEFFPSYMRSVRDVAQNWLRAQIRYIRELYGQVGPRPRFETSVLATLRALEDEIADCYIGGYN